MVRIEDNYPYDISDFVEKANKYFPDENILVGMPPNGSIVDESIIHEFFDSVMDFELNELQKQGKLDDIE